MKAQRLINAITKTGKIIQKETWSETAFKVVGPRNYLTFHIQGENAVCVSTCTNGDGPRSEVDYFPQSFHNTIKGAIYWLNEPAEGYWRQK